MNSKLLQNLPALCNMVRRIAVEAGQVTLDYFEESGFQDAKEKSDGSPVTIADRAAEDVIEKGLAALLPGIPMVGEESAAAGNTPDLTGQEYFWMVDPLDGTKEFISGSGDYTVNIALIHQSPSPPSPADGGESFVSPSSACGGGSGWGRPVLGVIYAPVPGELYAGSEPGSAIRYFEDTDNEKPIQVRGGRAKGLTVVASRNHGDDEKLSKFLKGYKVEKVIKRGSSLKICAVASGKADLYPRFGATCEWDTAAGDAILRAAGGIITDFSDNPLRYGKAAEKFLNPEFLACPEYLRLEKI